MRRNTIDVSGSETPGPSIGGATVTTADRAATTPPGPRSTSSDLRDTERSLRRR